MTERPKLSVTDGSQGLVVDRLRKSYRKRPVIRDVSLRLARGEVVALLGPNGSGKTTSFYCIAGLITPDGGSVTIDGQDVTQFPMYRRARAGIGYLPQEMSIFRGLSVEDNILAILEVVERDRARQLSGWRNCCRVFHRSPASRARVVAVGRRTTAGLRSHAALPRIRAMCCLMNPLPGWTRSPWATSATLCKISRPVESAF